MNSFKQTGFWQGSTCGATLQLKDSTRWAPAFRLGAWLTAVFSLLSVGNIVEGQDYSFITIAGTSAGSTDGTGGAAQFYSPGGVAPGGAGSLFVADTGNQTIRQLKRVGTDWVSSTVAGLAGAGGDADGVGSAARFNHPRGVAVDGGGNIYVTSGNAIRQLTVAGAEWASSTIAGNWSSGDADGVGSVARFSFPTGLAVDSAGNVYVADTSNRTIRQLQQIGATWVSSTIAGLAGNSGGADGTNSAIRFRNPVGVAVDNGGNLYVGDTASGPVLRQLKLIGADWVSATISIAASGVYGYPAGVAADSAGNIFIANSSDVIQRLNFAASNWSITTIGGLANSPGRADGIGSAARFNFSPVNGYPGVAVDAAGNLYLADNGNNAIRQAVAQSGPSLQPPTIITQPQSQTVSLGASATFSVIAAGSGLLTYQWQFNGNDLPIAFRPSLVVTNVQLTNAGNYAVLVANSAGVVTSLVAVLQVQLLAPTIVNQPQSQTVTEGADVSFSVIATGDGSLTYQWRFSGQALPSATNATLVITNVQFGDAGVYYVVVGNGTSTIWSVGVMLTVQPSPQSERYSFIAIAGQAGASGSTDGTNNSARFNAPQGLAVDNAGDVFVADTGNHTIRQLQRFGTNWVSRTIAGLVLKPGYADGVNSAIRFTNPNAVAVDGAGNLYVTDYSAEIRKLTLVGSDWVSSTIGTVNNTLPYGVAVDNAGAVYVPTLNSTIVQFTPRGSSWESQTIAGLAGAVGSADGTSASARFNFNLGAGIAADSLGNLFVADTQNYTIRKLNQVGADWVTSTIAGMAQQGGSADGTNNAARFLSPQGVAVDTAGNLFVADVNGDTVRRLTPVGTNWISHTIAGASGMSGSADGTNAVVSNPAVGYAVGGPIRFFQPNGVAVDHAGHVFVADTLNNAIREGTPVLAVTASPPQFQSVIQSNALVVLTWSANIGRNYQVQYNSDLGSTNWLNLGSAITASSQSRSASDNIGPDRQRFYRIVLLP